LKKLRLYRVQWYDDDGIVNGNDVEGSDRGPFKCTVSRDRMLGLKRNHKKRKPSGPGRQSTWTHSEHTSETLLPEPNNSESGKRMSSVYPLRQTLADKSCRYIPTHHCTYVTGYTPTHCAQPTVHCRLLNALQ
jgi:hypothetical protein